VTQVEPQFLYRYRHLQGKHRRWTSRILTHSVLHFAAPTSFNDPYDCKVHFRPRVSSADLRRKHVALVKKYMPQLNRAQRRAKVAGDLKTVDPDEFLLKVSQGLQEAVEKLGVLSLSASDRNILLWSHYAAGHTGLCLKFLATADTPFFGRAQPVQYSVAYPEVELLRDSPDRHIDAFLLTKAIDWKYEEEWRIIDHDSGPGEKVFPEGLLVGVILGARMPTEDKEVVVKRLGARKDPVQIYQASVSRASFGLEINPYEP